MIPVPEAPSRPRLRPRPTDAAGAVFADPWVQVAAQLAALDRLVADDLPGFNERVGKAGLGAVVVP